MCDTDSMVGIIRNIVLAVLAVLVGVLAVFLVGMRRKSPPVLDAVRRLNKAVSNPKQMETAGQPGAYASIVEHVGRRSGTTYQTPIGTEAVPGGFLVALPYGTTADWVQNVLAAGGAVITAEGETVRVDQPEILAATEIADQLPASEQRLLRLFNVEQFLRVQRVDAEPPEPLEGLDAEPH